MKIKLHLFDPCPCGSNRNLRDCCYRHGYLRKTPAILVPTGPQTKTTHHDCYLGFTENCSNGRSAEHYISRSVLKVIGDKVNVSGLPWLNGEMRTIGVSSLTANILCERHNSALAPVDDEAGRFFKTINDIFVEMSTDTLTQRARMYLFSGEMIEQWLVKILCGLYYSRNASNLGARLIDTHTLSEKLIVEALFRNHWQDNAGLYIRATIDHGFQPTNAVAIAPLSSREGKRLAGIGIVLGGIEFTLILEPGPLDIAAMRKIGFRWRPSELAFQKFDRIRSIALTWPKGTSPLSILHEWESRK